MPPLTLPDPPLRTDRIELRPPTEADVDRIVEICRDPEIPRWTRVPANYSADHAREFIAIAERGRASGWDLPFLIHRRSDDAIVGACGVHAADARDLVGEIGYWAAPDARGQGYVTEAVVLLRDWAWDVLPYSRLEINTAVDNHASRRVATKVGFTEEAVLRSALLLGGQRHDKIVHAQLRDERRAAPPAGPFLEGLARRSAPPT